MSEDPFADTSPDRTEWYMIEVQGDFKTKTEGESLNGHLVGDLLFTQKGVPVMIIGHHIMHGKVVKMEKPMAVLTRNSAAPHTERNHEGNDHVTESSTVGTDADIAVHTVTAIIRTKLIFKTRPKPIIANVPKKV